MKPKLLSLFAISFLALFLELCLIRWLPSQVRALAYFKNLALISSFLGMGLGMLLRRRGQWLATAFPLLLLLEIAVANLLGRYRITGQENPDEHLWLLYFDLPQTAPLFPLSLAIPIFYVLNTLTFIPFGYLLSKAMQEVNDPILAYVVNVLGGLAGTLVFVGLSFVEVGPLYWFVPSLLFYAALVLNRPRALGLSLLAVVALLLIPIEKPGTIWSPYYALSLRTHRMALESESPGPMADGDEPASMVLSTDLSVNGSFHQSAFNVSTEARTRAPGLEELYQAYLIPYRAYRAARNEPAREVLVVGAGTGNDVAVALQQGATHVDAVEIDPVILRLGTEVHPNRVYDDPRVHRYVDDARHFLQNAPRRYDLVVFGTLDSQIALSALSTIRLDNYVYTVESMKQARQVLKEDGFLALYFSVGQEWIQARLAGIVEEAFGYPPEVTLNAAPSLFNMVVIARARPPSPVPAGSEGDGGTRATTNRPRLIPNDDWPYLYQRERAVSKFYVTQILALLLISVALLALTLLHGSRAQTKTFPALHLPLFLQGMAFLLLETRSISVISLLFGATWVVSAIVIAAVLLIITLANLAIRATHLRSFRLPFTGLAVTLIGGYLFPTAILLEQDILARLAVSILVYLSPIFFSSMIFAILFDQSSDITWAYGSNLLGAVLGGLGEYIAVMTGLRALSLIALAIFVPVVLLSRSGRMKDREPATAME